MARYLTPSKVGLLVLVSVYTEKMVPASASIPVLSFLISSLQPEFLGDNLGKAVSAPKDAAVSIDGFQAANMSHASAIPGRTVWDLFLKKMWEIDSLDAFHFFLGRIELFLQKNIKESELTSIADPVQDRMLLSKASPLGAFVRRAQLEFSRLRFHDGVKLWQKFVGYRLPTLPLWRKRNPLASAGEWDVNLSIYGSNDKSILARIAYGDTDPSRPDGMKYISAEDIEKLLEHQVNAMHSEIKFFICNQVLSLNCIGMGTRMPEEVTLQLRHMLRAGVSMPNMYYYVQ